MPERAQESRPVDRPSAVAGAAAIYAAAITLPNVMPALLGMFADGLGLNATQLGIVGAAFPAGLGLMALSSFAWVRRVDWRICTASGLLLLAMAVGLQARCTGFYPLVALMGVAGLGAGLAASPSIAALGDSRDPQRSFGVMIFLSVLLPAGVLASIPAVIRMLGHGGVFLGIGALFGLCALFAVFIPRTGQPATPAGPGDAPAGRMIGPLAASLSCMVLFAAGYIAAWNFLERIGDASAIAHEQNLDALALGGLVGGLGGFVAQFLARSMTLRTSFLLAIGFTILTLGLLELIPLTVTTYLLVATSFQLWVNVNFSNILTFIASEDREGSAVALIPGLQCLGAAAGSIVAGAAFDHAGRTGVVVVGVSAFLLCSTVMTAGFRAGRLRPRRAARHAR